ncbi:MAG: type II toxin-antitoxin system RelE/ParE family toxin [Gammaproteobacteria bacterium]|nr:type II toxin-antitoxin system RelE/ParE family toxin [Gammaproteobacteria bacterium]
MRIEWARSARDDLRDLRDYIAKDSPYYAQAFIERIIAAVESLPAQPQRGRRVPEADRDDVRELLFQNYRIIYLLRPDTLYVVTVVHGSRDLERRPIKPWEVE